MPFMIPPMTGQPFTLTEKVTTVKQAADGTTFTSLQEIVKYRDSEGRTRQTTKMIGANGSPRIIQDAIEDPVGHQYIVLNPAMQTATVNHSNPPKEPSAPRPISDEQRAAQAEKIKAFHAANGDFIHETLAGKQIAGVYAVGERVTHIVPAGKEGNDREFKVIMETWMSPDLKIQLYQSMQDPRIGTMTHEVTDLSRADPDPSIFQVPAGYKVKDIAPRPVNPQ